MKKLLLILLMFISYPASAQDNVIPDSLYSYNGLHTYYLSKDKFNIDEAIKLSQSLAFSNAGYVQVFFYDTKIEIQGMENANKKVPYFLMDEAYKNMPYFVFLSTKDNQESYCTFDGTKQLKYHRSIVQGEKEFSFVSLFDYGVLNAMSGCAENYKPN